MVPSIVTYNAMVGICDNGTQLERALELFGAIQQQEVVPDLITYNALISTYHNGKHADRALELFEVMQRRGMVPDSFSLTCLISICQDSSGRGNILGNT